MPFYLLIFILVFAPLSYGASGPVALTVFQALCLLGLLWVLIEGALGKRRLVRPPGLLPLGLLGALMLLQVIPLPPSLLKLLSPTAWQRYADTVWLLLPETWMPLSLNRGLTLEAFWYFSACLAIYVFASQCLAGSTPQKRALHLIAAFAGLYALISILSALVPNGHPLWLLHPWPDYASKAFGSYLNGNHYAGLMGMLLPLVTALFLLEKPVARYGDWKERLVDFFGDPRLNVHLLSGMAALLIGVSIFLSLSRGGILSSLAALMILSLLLISRSQERRRALILLGMVVVLFFSVGVFGWEPIFAAFARMRNLQGEISDGRLTYWADCFALFRDFPLFGTGFGSFIDSYAPYQSIYHGELVVNRAHNDYVELLADGGGIAVALAGWAALQVGRASWKAFGRRRRAFSVYLFLGAGAGLCAILLHSLTDYNLHIGANGIHFAFLCSLLVSAAHTTSQRNRSGSELPPLTRRLNAPALLLLTAVLIASLLLNIGGLFAASTLATIAREDSGKPDSQQLQAFLQQARQAAAWTPFDGSGRFTQGNVLAALGRHGEALQAYGEALRLRPLRYSYLQRAAHSAGALGLVELEESLLKAGVTMDQADLRPVGPFATFLLKQNRRAEAFVLVRRSLDLAPEKTGDFLTLMALQGVDWREMKEALPPRALAWQLYAAALNPQVREAEAEAAYRRAVRLVADEPRPWTGPYWAFYRFLNERKRTDEALALILDAIERFPDDAGLQRTAGSLYEQQGITILAIEAYRQALLLDPKQKWVKARLEKLGR
ncbi:O-antigen ligase family protein [Trichloromonas sp.]|uniref:O-antigen ligase family protein n=1 Tax=Trichloromonas sp. TaxID=3069249 RepID=UPI003D81C169